MRAGLVIFCLMYMLACGKTQTSAVQSYQTRADNSYVYMLTHTAALSEQPEEKTDVPIARADFDKYGSCFYKVVSDKKLRLHRQDDLQRALARAELVNSNYIPLDELWQQFRKERDLQELYTSSQHWLYPLIGGVGMLIGISSLDSILHRGNGVIVENSAEHVVKNFKPGNRTLKKQTLETLHVIADAEHASDELVRKFATIGKHNPLRRLNQLLMDNKLSQGIAKLFGKTCVGRARATACLVGYLIAFNSMFVIALPVGSDRLGGVLARWRNRTTEDNILSDLLGDRHSLTNTHLSSEKTMRALNKIARLTPAVRGSSPLASSTPACPARPEVH